ncbi:MAG: cytochrome c biogenesis protein [Proteobacteria bacterium]|nr:cytochrome c biogenesis protein [Pseudomonadota bacterium]MBU1688123.1 cytochrome c biogenesis protein [Pseudomonadota bacterium]
MEQLLDLTIYRSGGHWLLVTITALSVLLGIGGVFNLFRTEPLRQKELLRLLTLINLLFVGGFLMIGWLHWSIHQNLPLNLSPRLAEWLNQQLGAANTGAAYGLPLYNPQAPPRYSIPLWIEHEKYYFWFLCFSLLAQATWGMLVNHRFRGAVQLVIAIQGVILLAVADPFAEPLPKFFTEITPWFTVDVGPMAKAGMFMKLYPRMIFYYNAHYMWLHPPMLFLAYACITLTFLASCFMLVRRDPPIEKLGYSAAKLGYLMLTLGMLLGYPWALQAWGPNWWWDPKIGSSIMMWMVYSGYLHTRLYANKPAMWYFSSLLGILCFVAMIYTFLASFLFPGEHTFQ